MRARRAWPDRLFRENRTPLNFQTGSQTKSKLETDLNPKSEIEMAGMRQPVGAEA
jgi:hypothetical protein